MSLDKRALGVAGLGTLGLIVNQTSLVQETFTNICYRTRSYELARFFELPYTPLAETIVTMMIAGAFIGATINFFRND